MSLLRKMYTRGDWDLGLIARPVCCVVVLAIERLLRVISPRLGVPAFASGRLLLVVVVP